MRIAISTPTEAEYNELMEHLESKGYIWADEKKPTEYDFWFKEMQDTAISITEKEIQYADTHFYREENYFVIPYSELKANNFKIVIEM